MTNMCCFSFSNVYDSILNILRALDWWSDKTRHLKITMVCKKFLMKFLANTDFGQRPSGHTNTHGRVDVASLSMRYWLKIILTTGRVSESIKELYQVEAASSNTMENRWWFSISPLFSSLPRRNKARKTFPLSDPLSMTDIISLHKLQPVYQPSKEQPGPGGGCQAPHTQQGESCCSAVPMITPRAPRRAHWPSLMKRHTADTCRQEDKCKHFLKQMSSLVMSVLYTSLRFKKVQSWHVDNFVVWISNVLTHHQDVNHPLLAWLAHRSPVFHWANMQ